MIYNVVNFCRSDPARPMYMLLFSQHLPSCSIARDGISVRVLHSRTSLLLHSKYQPLPLLIIINNNLSLYSAVRLKFVLQSEFIKSKVAGLPDLQGGCGLGSLGRVLGQPVLGGSGPAGGRWRAGRQGLGCWCVGSSTRVPAGGPPPHGPPAASTWAWG